MGGLFGGGSSAPTYIPAPQAVQATMTDSVDANKAVADSKDKIQKQLAAKSNSANDTFTSPQGVIGQAEVNNKTLLGQ